jgi:hypothetical protein
MEAKLKLLFFQCGTSWFGLGGSYCFKESLSHAPIRVCEIQKSHCNNITTKIIRKGERLDKM